MGQSVQLKSIQAKLLRLAMDKAAGEPEAIAAFLKFRSSLHANGQDTHALVDQLESSGFVAAGPNYGLCTIPFGKKKGQLFRDSSPFELRSIRAWCMADMQRRTKFATLIRDIDGFLSSGDD